MIIIIINNNRVEMRAGRKLKAAAAKIGREKSSLRRNGGSSLSCRLTALQPAAAAGSVSSQWSSRLTRPALFLLSMPALGPVSCVATSGNYTLLLCPKLCLK